MDERDQLSCRTLVPSMDGVELNKLHPDTFEIPSDMDKNRIRPGDFVKAGFASDEGDRPSERMWVSVVEVDVNLIRGTLASTPILVKAKFGDAVWMNFRHVLAIQEGL